MLLHIVCSTAARGLMEVIYCGTMQSIQKQSREAITNALDKHLYGYAAELAKAHLVSYPKDGIAWIEFARALTHFRGLTKPKLH
jgi:hypothetical protein